jgi:hypothetical protein
MKLALLYLLVITSFILSSCKKKINTTANIYVRDETQALVNNAMVILYGENTTGLPNQVSVYDTAYTNTQGLATFDYNYLFNPGQAGVAVLSIKVEKDDKSGIGIIKIEEEKVNEETVFIQP